MAFLLDVEYFENEWVRAEGWERLWDWNKLNCWAHLFTLAVDIEKESHIEME